MKKILILMAIVFLASSLFSNPTSTPTASIPSQCGITGADWYAATLNAALPFRYFHNGLVYDAGSGPRMWVVGGAGSAYPHKNDVWSSANGADWVLATGNAAFNGRSAFGCYNMNGKVWIVGGEKDGVTKNEVWHSTNMTDWHAATLNAAFYNRNIFLDLQYNDGSGEKMWMIAGSNQSNGWVALNHVWSSSNGTDWVMTTGNAAFTPRILPGGTVYDGKMWVIGGLKQDLTALNDVWWSVNGSDWVCAVSNAPFAPRLSHSVVVYDGKMWVIGGETYAQGVTYTDVWYTTDGVNWTKAADNTTMGHRRESLALVYDSRLFMIGGTDGKAVYYTCGAYAPTPTPTPACSTGIAGYDWALVTGNAAYGENSLMAVAAYDGALWSMFGSGAGGIHRNDVWKSYNGADWQRVTENAGGICARSSSKAVAYDNKLFIIAGDCSGTTKNDVWWSVNGAEWNLATGNAAFSVRCSHSVVVYQGKMWLSGGIPNSSNYPRLNDVWYSTDGATWTAATTDAAFPKRGGHKMLVHNDGNGEALYIIGGHDGLNPSYNFLSDVWKSTDGANWTQLTSSAPFGGREFVNAQSIDGKIVVAGGMTSGGYVKDAWVSTDGITWTKTSNDIGSPYMGRAEAVVLGNELYIVGGGSNNDVVKTGCTLIASTPIPTQTPTPGVNCIGGVFGADWSAPTRNAAFGGRSFAVSFVYDGAMWMTGGSNGFTHYRDVWKSYNGADWTIITSSTAPLARAGAAGLVYNNKMYLTAGSCDGPSANDVWQSTNGADWSLTTGNAAFAKRNQHAMAVFQGKMWIIGGIPDGGSYPRMNDVWYSTNGADWILANSNAQFSKRGGHKVVVHNDGSGEKMYLIGGHDGLSIPDNFLNDVWVSSDGANWTQITASAPFSGRYGLSAVSADGKIIIAVGGTNAGNARDVWSSPDGINWTLLNSNFGFEYGITSVDAFYNGEFYIIGGGYKKEVWKTGCSVIPPTATSTVTLTRTIAPTSTITPTRTITATITITPTPAPTDAPTAEPTPAVTVVDNDTSVYPSVGKDSVKIVFNTNKKADIKIYVYAIDGKLVDTVDYTTGWTPNDKLYQIRLDTSGYKPGTYFYTIQGRDDTGKIINFKSKKFIIKK